MMRRLAVGGNSLGCAAFTGFAKPRNCSTNGSNTGRDNSNGGGDIIKEGSKVGNSRVPYSAGAPGQEPPVSSVSEQQQDALEKKDTGPGSDLYDPPPFVTGVQKVKWLPLKLIEEIPRPAKILTEIELLMTAWSEEQAKYFFVFTWFVRILAASIFGFMVWFALRVSKSLDNTLRGTDNMPSGLRIGNVVYFDFEISGRPAGRVTIGLFNEDCPLYCEYFHRRCTGSGGNGDSFRGLPVVTNNHMTVAMGLGSEMTHDVPGFNPLWMPTEKESVGPWRGAISAINYTREKQSPNFQFHMNGSKDTPQIFGMVLSGFDTLERIHRGKWGEGGAPIQEVVVGGCGELCTLDKSLLTPLPWSLFKTISLGYDQAKYGPISSVPESMLAMDG